MHFWLAAFFTSLLATARFAPLGIACLIYLIGEVILRAACLRWAQSFARPVWFRRRYRADRRRLARLRALRQAYLRQRVRVPIRGDGHCFFHAFALGAALVGRNVCDRSLGIEAWLWPAFHVCCGTACLIVLLRWNNSCRRKERRCHSISGLSRVFPPPPGGLLETLVLSRRCPVSFRLADSGTECCWAFVIQPRQIFSNGMHMLNLGRVAQSTARLRVAEALPHALLRSAGGRAIQQLATSAGLSAKRAVIIPSSCCYCGGW